MTLKDTLMAFARFCIEQDIARVPADMFEAFIEAWMRDEGIG